MAGFFVAAAAVAVIQLARVREPRLLPLAALFALLAAAHAQPDPWRARRLHWAAGAAGLVLLVVLSPRTGRPGPKALR